MKTKLFFLATLLSLCLTASANRLSQSDTEALTDTVSDDDTSYYSLLDGVFDCNCDPYADEELPTSPSEVKHWIKERHGYYWYVAQAQLWHNAALSKKTDETAWFNYFRAVKYSCDVDDEHTYEQIDSIRHALVDELKQQVPDSYTYYCAAYQMNADFTQAEEAIKRMPTQKSFYDYDTWLAYYHFIGDSARMVPYAKEYIESGLYSRELLTYTMNELNTLSQNAIYLANGDANIIPKWIIQEGMGLHRDKLVIIYDYISDANYAQNLFSQLGIGDAPKHEGSFEDYDEYMDFVQSVVDEIVQRTGRPLYMSKNMDNGIYNHWNDNLYDEGFVYHYTHEDIDYEETLRKNYEQHCDLSYLLRPLPADSWVTDREMSYKLYFDFRFLLLSYLKDKDNKHFNTLKRQLIGAGMRNGLSKKEMKETIEEFIAEFYEEETEEL